MTKDAIVIEVRRDQAEWLQDIQGPSGTYKTALDKAREGYEASAGGTDIDDDAIDAILAGQTEIQEETARMAESLEAVEERTGSMDRTLEDLGGR